MNKIKRFKLVMNGKFTVPLFHGTTEAFLDSIKVHGLGGLNIIEKCGISKAFPKLFDLCEKNLSELPDFSNQKLMFQHMISQKVTCFNMRHGGTYVSPSRSTAERYANNPYGSEYISSAMELLEMLKEVYCFNDEEKQILAPLLAIKKAKNNPIMLEIQDVEVKYIQSEHGKEAQKNINLIEEEINRQIKPWKENRELFERAKNGDENAQHKILMDKFDKEEAQLEIEEKISDDINYFCQQNNFELKQKVSFDCLKVHYLV